jgi:preflagellin peptidase FlaK
VDYSEPVTAVRLAAALAVLCYASVLDWRTRKVSNILWILLSVLGLLLIPIQISVDKEPLKYGLVIAPILAVLADVYWDIQGNSLAARMAPAMKYGLAILLVILLGYMWADDSYFQHILAVPVFMMVVVLMYMLDMVRGGADAKALMALAILFPFYPAIGSIPVLRPDTAALEVVFPFAFNVLVNAAVIVALFPIGFLLKNAMARELRLPYGLVGYKLDVNSLVGRHVWLMESVEEGVHRMHMRPIRAESLEDEATKLKEAGHSRVWVTPKIPFIIPMTASLVLTSVIGNILLDLFRL